MSIQLLPQLQERVVEIENNESSAMSEIFGASTPSGGKFVLNFVF